MNLNLGDTKIIIDECRRRGLLRNQTAYVLATAYHETAHTMKPVREYGGEKYLKSKPYYPYVGMGYVQLTWADNYRLAGNKLGHDFIRNPKRLLEASVASQVLVLGMQEGWFTGKKLSDYITLTRSGFKSARRIVNGTDKADLIAGYAKQYDADLKQVGYGEQPTKTDEVPDEAVKEEVKQKAKAPIITIVIGIISAGLVTLWDWIINLPCNLFGWC